MTLRQLQHRAVDSIKRHALRLSLGSPRAQAHILTEYLWSEEGAETAALHRTRSATTPEWVDKLAANQLADELRHASLLRERLIALGARTDRTPPGLVRAKLWWLERVTAPYLTAFEQGPVVVLMAVAAQLEGTGVRMFGRHLAVLEEHEPNGPTAVMIRSILSDEKRHAKSCATAAERLVRDDERPLLEQLRARIADVDRAFGMTISVAFWIAIAANVVRDRAAGRAIAKLRIAAGLTGNRLTIGRDLTATNVNDGRPTIGRDLTASRINDGRPTIGRDLTASPVNDRRPTIGRDLSATDLDDRRPTIGRSLGATGDRVTSATTRFPTKAVARGGAR